MERWPRSGHSIGREEPAGDGVNGERREATVLDEKVYLTFLWGWPQAVMYPTCRT